eukprot:420149_1
MSLLYCFNSIEDPKIRLRYRVCITILALFFEDISMAQGGKTLQSRTVKYRSQKVAFLPERFDRYPKIAPKLLMEDDFEAEFKHIQANNVQLHQNTSLGQKDAELNNTLNMDTNKIPLKLNNNNS